jgi:hypothetical protein
MIGFLLSLFACEAGSALPFGSTAADCAACHPEEADAWARSRHAQAAASPVFAAMLPEVEASWGSFARSTCETCHAPGFGVDDGIGCVACHAAVGNHGARDGRLAVDLDAPLSGPLGLAAGAAHTSVPRGLLTDDTLCATCHTVTGPGLLAEDTEGEIRISPEADATCVGCHAPAVDDGPLTPGTPARPRHDHRYVGVDPPWELDPTDAEAAAASEALLARALTMRVDAAVGRTLVVTNTGAGHRVPTGVSFLRDVWVDVDDGAAETTVLRLGDQPTHGGVPVPLLVDADAVQRGSLASGESATAALPAAGPLVLHLRARALRLDVLTALGLDDLAALQPVHELATLEVPG